MDHDVVQLPCRNSTRLALRFAAGCSASLRPSTYHCDLLLPPGLFNRFVNLVVQWQNNMAALLSNQIVTYTQDYADHSSYLSRYKFKLQTILPPVELPAAKNDTIQSFADTHHRADRKPVIGMAARFAAEKGVEVLFDALPVILKKYPNAQVLFAGQYQKVIGEQDYHDRLIPCIREYENAGHWTFLGNLNPAQMSAFYPNLDVLVVPSLNSRVVSPRIASRSSPVRPA